MPPELEAIEFIEAEILSLDAETKKAETEKSILGSHIATFQKQEQEIRQAIADIETTSASLLDDFKKLKQLKGMMLDLKKLRDSNRILKEKIENKKEMTYEILHKQ